VEKNQITLEELKKQDPEWYFQEILELGEFEELKELVENSDWVISWVKLIKVAKIEIVNRKILWIIWTKSLDFRWTFIKKLRKIKEVKWSLDCEWASFLEDLGDLEEVKWDLDIRWTSIKSLWKLKKVKAKVFLRWLTTLEDLGDLEEVGFIIFLKDTKIKSLWKLKKIWLNLDCEWVNFLEDLGDLEEVGWDLRIEGSKIKSLGNLKLVKGDVDCSNHKMLEDLWKLERIWWYLDIRGLSLELQIDIMKDIEKWLLKPEWDIYFWWIINGIEELKIMKELKSIPWYLDISELAIKDQIDILYKEDKNKQGSLIIGEGIVEIFHKLYQNNKLNYENFETIIWTNLEQVINQEILDLGTSLLFKEYERIKIDTKNKGICIIEQNSWKELTEEQKTKIRDKLKALDIELKEKKAKIESFGIAI